MTGVDGEIQAAKGALALATSQTDSFLPFSHHNGVPYDPTSFPFQPFCLLCFMPASPPTNTIIHLLYPSLALFSHLPTPFLPPSPFRNALLGSHSLHPPCVHRVRSFRSVSAARCKSRPSPTRSCRACSMSSTKPSLRVARPRQVPQSAPRHMRVLVDPLPSLCIGESRIHHPNSQHPVVDVSQSSNRRCRMVTF